jgi:ubiquinone/menaquinone biosynthesis C-methylase UbiE
VAFTLERTNIAQVSAEAIHECLIDTKGMSAIDFGCGIGLVGLDLLNDFESVLFLDTSQNMINQVKQKLSDLNLEKVDTICFDLEQEDLKGIHVDYIFMAQVLLHIKNVDIVLARLYDVLNDGGHLLIVDFDKNEQIDSDLVYNGFEQTKLADEMSKLGYKNIQSKTFYSGSKIFMGQDASMFILDAQK